MNRLIFLTSLLILTNTAHAQEGIFTNLSQYAIGSTTADAGQVIAYDNLGDIVVFGFFGNSMDFDPGAGNMTLSPLGNPDIFLSKYTPAGSLVWAFNLGRISLNNGMNASGIAINSDNEILISGSFSHSVNFNPLGSTATKSSMGGKDAFLAKYNSDGGLIWVKTFGSIFYEYGGKVAVDSDDNIYFSLSFNGDVDVDTDVTQVILNPQSGAADAAIVKYNANGDYLWNYKVSTPNNDNITALNVATTGEVAIGATVNGSLSGFPNSDMNLVLLNSDGSLNWEYNFDNFTNASAISRLLFSPSSSEIYIAGRIQGNTDFDPSPGNSVILQPIFADPFFAKYKVNDGTLHWATFIESGGIEDYVSGITLVGSTLVALGSFDNTALFVPGDFTTQVTSAGQQDVYMVAFDNTYGSFITAKTFGGVGGEFSRHAHFNGNGEVIVTGSFSNSVHLNPNVSAQNSIGMSDIFIAEFEYDPSVSITERGPLNSESVKVFPIPAQDKISIQTLDIDVHSVSVKIYSIIGQVVYERIFGSSKLVYTSDISHLVSGVYILELTIDGERIAKRIVKN